MVDRAALAGQASSEELKLQSADFQPMLSRYLLERAVAEETKNFPGAVTLTDSELKKAPNPSEADGPRIRLSPGCESKEND